MNKPIITASKAASMIEGGSTLMVGGFLGVGAPEKILIELSKSKKKGFTIISNDSGYDLETKEGTRRIESIGRLTANGQVKKIIASYIGANKSHPEMEKQGKIKLDLTPQGTLAEQIRAGGAGLGGILTQTGFGTVRALGKKIITIDGKRFLLEKALTADYALIHAHKADKAGNLIYSGTARNFNPLMAMAGKIVIAEVDEIAETGKLDPNLIHTPEIFVDYLVLRTEQR